MKRAPLLAALLLLSTSAAAQESGTGGVAVWDTDKPSSEALTPAAYEAKAGWSRVSGPADAVKGDAVVTNGRLIAVFRKSSPTAEVYSLSGGVPTLRSRVTALSPNGTPVPPLNAVAVTEVGRGGATVRATAAVQFRMTRGDVSIEAQPGPGAGRLRIESPGRFAVLPDFFADDILIDAARVPGTTAELPSENILLHLTGAGDAIVAAVFENRLQDVRVVLRGEGGERQVAASEIEFGGKKVWLSVLAGPRLWHSVEVKEEHANKVMTLDWTMPFPALWRVDFSRPEGLADSWDVLLQKAKDPGYLKPAWLRGSSESVAGSRKRFTETLGFFRYPCWTDAEGRGYLQPLDQATRTKFVPKLSYRGPAVLFPLGRVPETPAEASTILDILRNTLGVGPCEYLLDIESQKEEHKGMATCSARDTIEGIYKRGEQKKNRADILKALDATHAFVVHIRSRITGYVEFGRKVRAVLAGHKKAKPELVGSLDELDRIAREIEARVEERADRIKSPDDVARMNEQFRAEVLDAEGEAALAKVKTFGEELTRIGGNQDKLVSECRWVARTLRQQAAILLAKDPRLAVVAAEIRTLSQDALKNPSHYEHSR